MFFEVLLCHIKKYTLCYALLYTVDYIYLNADYIVLYSKIKV